MRNQLEKGDEWAIHRKDYPQDRAAQKMIDQIDTLRHAFREAQIDSERIPAKLKPIIAMPNFPELLVNMVEKAAG